MDELELLEQIDKKVDSLSEKQKKDIASVLKEAGDKADAAGKEAKEAADKFHKELTEKVEGINKEIAEKGATLKQMQDELAEYKAKKGRLVTFEGEEIESTVKLLREAFASEYKAISEQANEPKAAHKFKIKSAGTMTASANLTGNVIASYASTPAVRGRQKLHFRDLVNVIPSATGLWKFYRQNIPVGEGSVAFQTTHGATKSQLDYDWTEVTVTVDYLAGFVRIAKQMLQDLPFMQSYVSQELVEDYLRAEDLNFFGQLYTAATGSYTVNGTVTVERLIDAVAAVNENDYDVNGIVTTHAVWAKILKTKPADYSIPGGITITPNGDVLIMGIPLFKTKESYIGANKFLLGDWTKAAIIQTEGLNVNMYEQDQDNVVRNLITVKAEARVAMATLRTDAFVYGNAGNT